MTGDEINTVNSDDHVIDNGHMILNVVVYHNISPPQEKREKNYKGAEAWVLIDFQ